MQCCVMWQCPPHTAGCRVSENCAARCQLLWVFGSVPAQASQVRYPAVLLVNCKFILFVNCFISINSVPSIMYFIWVTLHIGQGGCFLVSLKAVEILGASSQRWKKCLKSAETVNSAHYSPLKEKRVQQKVLFTVVSPSLSSIQGHGFPW